MAWFLFLGATAFDAVAFVAILAVWRRAAAARNWVAAKGRIVSSRTEAIEVEHSRSSLMPASSASAMRSAGSCERFPTRRAARWR